VNVGVKHGEDPMQVWITETNASEPSMTRRNEPNVVKTMDAIGPWDGSAGNLITAQMATGV